MKTIEGEIIDADSQPEPEPASQVQVYQPPVSPLDTEPARFAVQLKTRGDNYDQLIESLCAHMVLDVDLVRIHFTSKDNCRHRGPPACTYAENPAHWSDYDLSKAGAEKVCGLLGLGARFSGIDDVRKAVRQGIDLKQIMIQCEILGLNGQPLSEGTGSCSMREVYDDLNKAVKKASKRAYTDAVKRIAGLSGIVTKIRQRMQVPPGNPPPRTTQDAPGAVRNPFDTGATLTHCPIGRTTKGKPWREIDTANLEWFVKNCTDKPDIVRAATDELSKRKTTPKGSAEDSIRNQSPLGNPSQQEDFDDVIPF